MNILIAGAGIGGLTAALCLARAGHQVRVVERTHQLSEVGAGLQCGANAIHVLSSLGLMEALTPLAVNPERIEFKDCLSGALLHSIDLADAYQRRYGAPYLHLHRADLQRVLYEAAAKEVNIEFVFGRSVESINEGQDRVSIVLDSKQQETGDCLLGADGIRSVVRQHIVGDVEPEYTGYVAWRGVVPATHLPSDFMDTVVSNFVGPDKHMVVYYVRDRQLVNFVGVVKNRQWREVSWVAKAPWQQLQADFSGWHPTVKTLINAVDRDQCYRWALCHHRPFSAWSTERVTLLGDAAHATLPFMAAGAALAIEDARVLQRLLTHYDDVGEALRRYQYHRIPRTTQVQRSSAQLGQVYHLRSRVAAKIAFKAISVLGKQRESLLPAYNANTVALS